MKRKLTVGTTIGLALVGVGALSVAAYIIATPHAHSSRLERLSWLATIVTILIGLPTIVFLLEQVRDLKRSMQASAFEATANRIGAVTDLFLAHADQYLELQSGATSVKSALLAERVLDIMDTELLLHASGLGPPELQLPSIEPWFVDLFRELPGLREVLDKRSAWYSADLRQLRREAN